MPLFPPTVATLQSAATGNGNGTVMNVSGYLTAIIHVVSSVGMSGGTTVNFEASVDGTTWVAVYGHQVGSQTVATTTTADGDFRVNLAGFGFLRARISGYSAGTTTITAWALTSPVPLNPGATLGSADAAAGSAMPAVGLMVYNGATWDRMRSANVFKSFAITAVTAGTPLTVWTPTAGKRFRVLGFSVVLSAAAQLILKDGGTEFLRTGSGTSSALGPGVLGYLGYLSTTVNNVLGLDVTTSGNLSGFVCGTEE